MQGFFQVFSEGMSWEMGHKQPVTDVQMSKVGGPGEAPPTHTHTKKFWAVVFYIESPAIWDQ